MKKSREPNEKKESGKIEHKERLKQDTKNVPTRWEQQTNEGPTCCPSDATFQLDNLEKYFFLNVL